jgi:predicted amidohydrolase
MPASLKVALVQLNARTSLAENMAATGQAIERAASYGVDIVALPEFWTYLGPYDGFERIAQTLDGPAITMLREQARRHHMIVHGGSIVEQHPTERARFYNTSVLIDRNGELVARYRKIHLFDVNLANGERHGESERIVAGEQVVTAELEGVTFGFSICYDLRFPGLYSAMAQRGASVIFVPAAFTLHTGRDHWEVLLRARAIENQCYVLAPAQVGSYPPGKQCYGRSMVVDPWGLVLAQAQDTPTVLIAELDMTQVSQVRAQIPCLQHRRPDLYNNE